jgi:hypothetical protein
MAIEEHAWAFMAYVAGLLADFDRYLAAVPPDPVRDLAAIAQPGLPTCPAGAVGDACSAASCLPDSSSRPIRDTVHGIRHLTVKAIVLGVKRRSAFRASARGRWHGRWH